MKLYYIPGSCSLAVHITLNEIGARFDMEKVDAKKGVTETGADYAGINPDGYVPALSVDGDVFTEAPAILQYLADTAPESRLAPAAGSIDRVRLQQQLNFTASELHKSFAPFFADTPPEGEVKEAALAKLFKKFAHLERVLADGREFIMGKDFTVADAYNFVVASWAVPTGIGLDRWPNVAAFVERVSQRPAVMKAMQAEGLTG
ncbi:glutathione transferase GstA [Hwanghaeella grinnelliae]|uniref:Glutathione transferase GstA n=1 Tax=Hwanghaeella grinnelliae TaxID=2500179 RepID=A0A437QKB7_9PROT|nr:glutathione transferase GstA [Hwanghaeella grinnelliae]RVU34958.1 glutathione transferase GstA [Hwanghaeella grinnelliae]